MNDEKTSLRVSQSSRNGKASYEVVEDIKGGGSKRLEVSQVENGYIVTANLDYKDKKGNWKYESKRYVSIEDPLEEIKKSNKFMPETPKEMSTSDIVSGIKGFLGDIPG